MRTSWKRLDLDLDLDLLMIDASDALIQSTPKIKGYTA